MIKTPVRYDKKGFAVRDEIGTVICKVPRAFDAGFNSVAAQRVERKGEHIAHVLNTYAEIVSENAQLKEEIRVLKGR